MAAGVDANHMLFDSVCTEWILPQDTATIGQSMMSIHKQLHSMVMRTPATRWQDASPTGNGAIGAMMYGQICNDTILLNHEALYYPRPQKTLCDVSDLLPEVRRLIEEAKYNEAAGLVPRIHAERGGSPSGSTSDFTAPYQPFCDIRVRTSTHGPFRHYHRGVDFGTGRIWIEWSDDAGQITRELIISRADDTLYLRIRGNLPGLITHRLRLSPRDMKEQAEGIFAARGLRPATYRTNATADGMLTLAAEYEGEFAFGAVGNVTTMGGSTRVENDDLVVEDADELLLRLRLFIREEPGQAVSRLADELRSGTADFNRALREHTELHATLFGRMTLELPDAASSNEEMLLEAYDDQSPTALMRTMFDYGRYLLICSSRPGGWPANLQGIWNGDYSPAWNSDFHTDENIQMNYWQALPGNMADLTLCVFDYFERYLDHYRENARKLFDCRGIYVSIAQTTDGIAHPSIWTNWISAAGWLGQIFYDYFLFTGDTDFLAKRAIPWLKEVALFYEDYLFEGANGRLVFSPSLSPENRPPGEGTNLLTVNATMDVAICREVLENLCAACELLGVEREDVSRWRAMLTKLPSYMVNDDGALCEWLHPGFRDNYHHRHQSHLYPLFPGFEITEESDPELYEACRIAVEKRLVIGLTSQSGWSLAHMANVYARLGEGNRALECIEILVRSSTGPNLFTYHNDWRNMGLSLWSSQPPFQIDANFGLSAAILEMLVFSKPGLIKLLPALPDRWPVGGASGIACRGGITADVGWNLPEREVSATLLSRCDQKVQVRFPGGLTRLEPVTDSSRGTILDTAGPYATIRLSANAPIRLQAVLS